MADNGIAVSLFEPTDDDKKRKANSNGDEGDVYLTIARKKKKKSDDDDKDRWFSKLRWTKSPDEEEQYADWTLVIEREDSNANDDDRVMKEGEQNKTKTVTSNVACNNAPLDDNRSEAVGKSSPASSTAPVAAESATNTYWVHRIILGPHSDYFKRIFGKGFSESEKQSSTIQLPAPAITLQHFETLLDYCYTGTLELNALNAVAMVYFGDYFQLKELKEEAQAFIGLSIQDEHDSWLEENEKSEELMAYYLDAQTLAMKDLQNSVVRSCARHSNVMKENTALSKIPDTEFWSRVWEARKNYPNQTVSTTKDWSDNAAHFIKQHSNLVDLKCFRALTHIDSLPIISSDAAVILMEQEQLLCPEGSDESALTCLQKRSTEALYDRKTGAWQVSKNDPTSLHELHERLEKLPRVVLKTIVSWTMECKGAPQVLSIEVLGAGEEPANGVYIFGCSVLGKIMFTRRGAYGGCISKFKIYAQSEQYCISATPEGSNEVILYYRTILRSQESCLPPKTEWNTRPYIFGPAPTLRIMNP